VLLSAANTITQPHKLQVPINPDDSVLLTLPFGGEVLKSLGTTSEEVEGILAAKRGEIQAQKMDRLLDAAAEVVVATPVSTDAAASQAN